MDFKRQKVSSILLEKKTQTLFYHFAILRNINNNQITSQI